jgi:hypothetical protein
MTPSHNTVRMLRGGALQCRSTKVSMSCLSGVFLLFFLQGTAEYMSPEVLKGLHPVDGTGMGLW